MVQTEIVAEPEAARLGAGIASGLIAALIWGGWPVVSRLGVEGALAPADVTALRFAVAGLVLLPLVRWSEVRRLGTARLAVLAGGAGVPYVLVMVGGLTLAPAGHAGVITPSCMLIVSLLGGRFLLGERQDARRLAGVAAILAGVCLIGWEGLSQGAPGAWRGDLLFVAGGGLWAGYTLAARAWRVVALQATALVSVVSLALFLLPYLVLRGATLLAAPLEEVAVQAVYQGFFAAILALLFYTRSVAILGAGRGAIFAALVPGVAILLALPVLGEVPSAERLTGLAMVTLGMVVALGLAVPGRWPRS